MIAELKSWRILFRRSVFQIKRTVVLQGSPFRALTLASNMAKDNVVAAQAPEHQTKEGGGVLVQCVNHATGNLAWKMMPPDYDYSQELARASFGDMLHDSERNRLYRAGLVAAIKVFKERGQEVHVLDIGTGTGLLSMMAAVEGVDSIVACEEFRPMAEIAAKVIDQNGFKDKIKLVRKRSTELTVGPGCDLEQRANILVTEVFDTELIGEGAIGTYNHANKHLLTHDRIVVPCNARMYAQLVSGPKLAAWNRLLPVCLPDLGVKGNLISLKLKGTEAINSLVLHDVQLSEMPEELFKPLSEPIEVFSYDLECRSGDIPTQRQHEFEVANKGQDGCHAVFVWWDCWMDPDKSILLSCAPKWEHFLHHKGEELPWRDHWMQAIYYPQEACPGKGCNGNLKLTAMHDEYSFQFDVKAVDVEAANHQGKEISSKNPENGEESDAFTRLPLSAGLQISRLRCGQLNDETRTRALLESAERRLMPWLSGDNANRCVIVCLGDQSLLSLLVGQLVSAHVQENPSHRFHIIGCEGTLNIRRHWQDLAVLNGLQDLVKIVSDLDEVFPELAKEKDSDVIILGDPFYQVSLLPWHNLLFWYNTQQIIKITKEVSANSSRPTIVLERGEVWALPVHYKDLWKIRAPLGTIEGFSMDYFDRVIDEASTNCDEKVEPHPLWEYPAIALGQPVKIASFNLSEDEPPEKDLVFKGSMSIKDKSKKLNGVSLWMEWHLSDGKMINTGPSSDIVVGEKVTWAMNDKQGVFFFRDNQENKEKDNPIVTAVDYDLKYVAEDCDLFFDFQKKF